MIAFDEARALLADAAAPLPSREVPLAEALGLRLAAAASAEIDVPPASVSAMDGYAARSAELGGAPLPLACEIPAGAVPPPLPSGAAARIFTGAPLPAGADTVVIQEVAEALGDGRVRLPRTPAGQHVRGGGEVVRRGDCLAAAGTVLSPQRLGLLAAGGPAVVRATPRPRVALLVTGSELAPGGSTPHAGQIRDSNGPMLAALARDAGLPVAGQMTAADDTELLRDTLLRLAREADVIISSGGVSVGDHDLVPQALRAAGGDLVLHRVRVQPGKPILVARLGKAWLVGLPGNPVSALVGWWAFVRPLAEALAGDAAAFRDDPLAARLDAPFRHDGDRTLLRPAVLSRHGGDAMVRVIPWKGSHDLAAAAPANALARFEPGQALEVGAAVPCYPLAWRPSP